MDKKKVERKRCKCGAFSKGKLCPRCKELKEIADEKQRLEGQLNTLGWENEKLKKQIREMKRYQVHANTVFLDMTWDGALRKAEELRQKGINYCSITDERGKLIRSYTKSDKGERILVEH